MMAKDVILLNQPFFFRKERYSREASRNNFRHPNDLGYIQERILELVAVHTGMFPYPESTITWHQMVEIVHTAKVHGPIKGVSTVGSERLISKLKKLVPKGGQSMHRGVFKKIVSRSVAKVKSTMNNNNHDEGEKNNGNNDEEESNSFSSDEESNGNNNNNNNNNNNTAPSIGLLQGQKKITDCFITIKRNYAIRT